MNQIGLVVIGRNEGERLRRCLQSARGHFGSAVYVDSGSTDGSVQFARSMGLDVVDLDTSAPFTAARARNAGVERLLQRSPGVTLIQFVDGDCEIVSSWWDAATRRMQERPELAAVCGRRRERFPGYSVYNRLCDLEWNTPVGDAAACGGDSMMRVDAFQQAGGFDPSLIAGEEPELCFRMRSRGWKIERIDEEMTLHDAAMTRFSQWWKREKRSGFAAAEGAHRYGHSEERYRVQMYRSNWFWGMTVPLLALAPAWWTYGASVVLLLVYPAQWIRIARSVERTRDVSPNDARTYATYCLLGKFPQMLGQIKYLFDRLLRKQSRLIEYKDTPDPFIQANQPAKA